jgi:voltage-gated potassium channel
VPRVLRQLGRELAVLYGLARREKLLLLIAWLFVIVGGFSVLFFFVEHGSNPRIGNIWDALYWGIVSFTTTGYGDVVPSTRAGQLAAVLLLLSYTALMPLVWAIITSIFISRRIKGASGLERLHATRHVVLCGWNNNGNNILAGLQERQAGATVALVGELAADHFENLAQTYPRLHLHYVRGPYANESVLQRANVRSASVAIVLAAYGLDSTLRSDEQTVLAVLTLRGLAPELRIVAECFASSNAAHLRRAGANRVIVSGELDGFMLTAAAVSPGLDMAVRDALSFGQRQDMWTHEIPPEFVGKRFVDLAAHWLQERCWILVGLVGRQKKLGIREVLSGDKSSIDDFITRHFEQAGRGAGGTHHLHYLNPGPQHLIRADDMAVVIYPQEG